MSSDGQQNPQQGGKQRPGASSKFLKLLREHGNFGKPKTNSQEGIDDDNDEKPQPRLGQQHPEKEVQEINDNTIRASNTEVDAVHRRSTSALPDLFVSPLGSNTSSPIPTQNVKATAEVSADAPPRSNDLPRTYTDGHEGAIALGLPKVESTATLNSSNMSTAATTTKNNVYLPPRPPYITNRDQSVTFLNIPQHEASDENENDELLQGEAILDGDLSQDAASNRKPSSRFPTEVNRKARARAHSYDISDGHLPMKLSSRLPPLKRPENVVSRARSVGQHSKQQHHQQNPSVYDIILNHHSPDSSGESSDYAIGMESNMLHNSDQPHHHQERDMLRLRMQSDAIRSINLEDLLTSSPYEIEAETNILKALEERPSARHRRYISETSTILSGVPDGIAHDFSLEESHSNTGATPGDGSQEGVYSSSYHLTANSTEDGHSMHRMPHPPLPATLDTTEEMPLITADKNISRHHRRTMSVEDQLAGLTIEYINMEENKNTPSAHDTKTPDTSGNYNMSSVESFQQNTSVTPHMDVSISPSTRNRTYTDFSDKLAAVVEMDEENPVVDTGGACKDSDDGRERNSKGLGEGSVTTNSQYSKRREVKNKFLSKTTDLFNEGLREWGTFFAKRRKKVLTYFKLVFIYMGILLIGASIVLFYAVDNPPTHDRNETTQASVAWWLLFCMRQIITLSLSLFLRLVIVDFLAVRTQITLRMFGPILTLLIVQSKGWPFVFFLWSVLDFAFIHGDRALSHHWLYWQDYVDVFNEENPSGDVVNSTTYTRVLRLTTVISVIVAIKRAVVGLWLSRNTFSECTVNQN